MTQLQMTSARRVNGPVDGYTEGVLTGDAGANIIAAELVGV